VFWTDQSTGRSFGTAGNDKSAYANMANQIQNAIDQGHKVDDNARRILRDAQTAGVYTPKY